MVIDPNMVEEFGNKVERKYISKLVYLAKNIIGALSTLNLAI